MVHESILVNNSLEEAENILKEIIPIINGKIKNISDEEYSIEWTYLYGLQTVHCETKLIPHKKGIEVFSTANAGFYKTGAKKALKNLYTALSQRINGNITNKKSITTQSLQSPNNTDYKSFIIVIVAVVLIIMYSNPPSNNDDLKIAEYVLHDTEENGIPNIPKIKLSIDVVLKKRVNEQILKELAPLLHKKYNGDKYQNVFIEYFLIGMIKGNGAYATTHYTPNLEMRLYGLSNEDIAYITAITTTKRYWIDDDWSAIIGIEKENKKFFLHRTFKDLSTDKTPLELYTKSNDTIFKVNGTTDGEYYKINSLGNLEQYDNKGLVHTKLKQH